MIQSNVPSKSSQQQREDAVGNGDQRELVSAILVAFDEQTEREYTSRVNTANQNKKDSDSESATSNHVQHFVKPSEQGKW